MLAASLLLLALGLAADAFAVAVAQGAVAPARPWRAAVRCGAAFGFAQAAAPLIGAGVGFLFHDAIQAVDHWVAFGLLSLIGGKLLIEGLKSSRGGADEDAPTRVATGWALAGLAVATSIDAVAAGFTLHTMAIPILISVAVIGLVTFALSAAGVWIGRLGARSLGWKAEALGGLALIGVGVKVLIDHRAFG